LKDEFIEVKFSYLFSFAIKRNKNPERHYSWSISDLMAKSKIIHSRLFNDIVFMNLRFAPYGRI